MNVQDFLIVAERLGLNGGACGKFTPAKGPTTRRFFYPGLSELFAEAPDFAELLVEIRRKGRLLGSRRQA